MPSVEDCDHDEQTFRGIDDESDEFLYREWVCDDCNALISDVYEKTDRTLVIKPDGELSEGLSG